MSLSLSDILALVSAMAVLVATPGPGVMLVLSRSLAGGFQAGFWLSLGIVLGDYTFILASIYGLSALATQMGEAFFWVNVACGIYLMWLGVQQIMADARLASTRESSAVLSRRANFLGGFWVTIGNPKAIFFYLGLFPVFIDASEVTGRDVLTIMASISLMVMSIMCAYAYLASRIKRFLEHGKALIYIHWLAGSIMLVAGVSLLLRA